MNERLEKEIESQIYDIFFDLCGVAIAGTSEYATVEDVAYIARHFYNLALEDVRKEVESMKKGVQSLKIDSDFNEGKLIMSHDILFFIDGLTK